MSENNSFEDIIFESRLLDNQSNKISKIYLDKLESNLTLELNNKTYDVYGYIIIRVKNPSNLVLYYKQQKLTVFRSSETRIIPCIFEEDGYIKLTGTSDNITIMVYGVSIKNQFKLKNLPIAKYVLKSNGSLNAFAYTSKNDILSGAWGDSLNVSNLVDVQNIKLDDTVYLAYLFVYDNNLYLCTSKDNYTTQKLVESGVEKAIIVPDILRNKFNVCYIKSKKLYLKSVSNTIEIGASVTIELGEDFVPISFGQLSINAFLSISIFAIVTSDGTMMLLSGGDTSYKKYLTKSADFSKLYIDDGGFELFNLHDNKVELSKFDVNGGVISTTLSTKTIYNVSDILKYDDNYILYNDEICWESTYDNL